MLIAVGADHAGFPLKQKVAEHLRASGHEVLDLGTFNTDPVDYPDYAEAVGKAIVTNQAERGVLVCGSGVGASVAANKVRGIRAGLCHDGFSAHQGVEDDDMNVLVLGARIIGASLAYDLIKVYLEAKFQGTEERLLRRLNKVKAIEARNMC